jgi:hypothetical protein
MADMLNMEVPDLPAGYVPLEVVSVIKCLDEAGNPTIVVRTSDGVMAWEVIGMLTAANDMARADLVSDMTTSWDNADDEDNDSA